MGAARSRRALLEAWQVVANGGLEVPPAMG